MKKLISVFAALALVGSLAAQKGKKPAAKAPAAPAVAAPKAPAVPAVVTAAPAAAGAAKGIGLFIEGRGTYNLGQGSTDSQATGDATAATVTYQLSNAAGFGGGGTLGFEIVKGLAIVGSYDYRSIKSRTWDTTKTTVSAALGGVQGSTSTSVTVNTQVIGVGFRPSVQALGGTFYAGMGFAYVLPFDQVTTTDISSPSNALFAVTQTKTTASKSAGIGAYGEFGYNFSITDNFYVGVGFRALVATANNDGKSDVKVTTGNVAGTAVADTKTDYSASVDSTKTRYQSYGITDAGVSVNVGVRF